MLSQNDKRRVQDDKKKAFPQDDRGAVPQNDRRQEVCGVEHCYFSVRLNCHSLYSISCISDINTSENWPEFLKLRT